MLLPDRVVNEENFLDKVQTLGEVRWQEEHNYVTATRVSLPAGRQSCVLHFTQHVGMQQLAPNNLRSRANRRSTLMGSWICTRPSRRRRSPTP
mgnify:CR=1 FL=1